jgi:hypothetical protein
VSGGERSGDEDFEDDFEDRCGESGESRDFDAWKYCEFDVTWADFYRSNAYSNRVAEIRSDFAGVGWIRE